jgi:hypothetical protein
MIAISKLPLCLAILAGFQLGARSQEVELPALEKWKTIPDEAALELRTLQGKHSLVIPMYDVEPPDSSGRIKVSQRVTRVKAKLAALGFESLKGVDSPISRPTAALKLDEGWLCSIFHGDYVNGLWLYDDEKKIVKKLNELRVVDFRTVGGRHYAAVQDERGATLMEVTEDESGLQFRELFTDPLDVVQALSQTVDNKLVMFCTLASRIVDDAGTITKLDQRGDYAPDVVVAESMEWASPTRAYIGGRGVVIRVDYTDKGRVVTYLTPDDVYMETYERLTGETN